VKDKTKEQLILEVGELGRRVAELETSQTDRKKAEALREDEGKFRLLFERSVDPILLLDGETFVECNEAAARIMGCSDKAQLIGLHPVDLPPERQPDGRASREKAQELFDAAFREGVIRFEWMHRTFRGEDLWVDVSLTVIPHRTKRMMYTVWRDITGRKRAEETLKTKSLNLEDVNAALKVLLSRREEDKKILENTILANVRDLISPYLDKLKNTHLNESQAAFVDIIESNLEDIVSPFVQKMDAAYSRFTPTEIQVANLIKSGRTSKEIASTLRVGKATIDTHRNNIRKKLGLDNKKLNLRTHLLSL